MSHNEEGIHNFCRCPSLNSGDLAVPRQPKSSGATTDAETGNICMFLWRQWQFAAKGILSLVCL